MYSYNEAIKELRKSGMTRDLARKELKRAREGEGGWRYANGRYSPKRGKPALTPEEVDYFFTAYSKYGHKESLADIAVDLNAPMEQILDAKIFYNITRESMPFYKDLYTLDEAADKLDAVSRAKTFRKLQAKRIASIEKSLKRFQNMEAIHAIDTFPYVPEDDFTSDQPTILWSMNDEHWGSGAGSGQVEEMARLASRCLAEIEKEQPKRIIIPYGSDTFHVDSVKGTTTKGTQLEFSQGVAEMSRNAISYFINCVISAIAICPVSIYITPGNHDRTLAEFSYGLLSAIFANNPTVSICLGNGTRAYHMCGDTLITLQHGDIMARNIDAVCFSEASELFNVSAKRNVLVQGHFHRFEAKSNGASMHVTTTSPSPRDRWTNSNFGSVSQRATTIMGIRDNEYPYLFKFVEV